MTGKKFGKWTVVGFGYCVTSSGRKVKKCMCLCKCGTKKLVARTDLTNGKSTEYYSYLKKEKYE